jgi:hypothetical protein
VPAVVWGVLALMTGVLLAHVARDGHNVPLSEDWHLVPVVAGEEGHFWSWVWSQNNEHRLPVARLVNLGLVDATRDFRAGMVLNTLLMAGAAAGLVLVARRLRGRTSLVDAFFPVVLLHLGHWANLMWSWQLAFVSVAAATAALVAVLVSARLPLSPPAVAAVGTLLVVLAVSGGTALPMVPAGIAALATLAFAPGSARRVRRAAIAASLLAAAAFAAYFVGWESPSWYSERAGIADTLRTIAKVLALAWGPAARGRLAVAGALAAAALVGSAAWVLFRARRDPDPGRRRRAAALGALLTGTALTIAAVGYGRAALVPSEGLPDRYVIAAVPTLVVSWLAWQMFGPPRARFAVQVSLLLAVALLVPRNVAEGYEFRDWYTAGMDAVERDLRAGAPVDVLVDRHGEFLMHWDDDLLAARMRLLAREGIGPFAELHVGWGGTGAAAREKFAPARLGRRAAR